MRVQHFVFPAVILLAGCTTSGHYPMQARAAERCAPFRLDDQDVKPPKLVEHSHLSGLSDELPPGRPGGMPGRPAFNFARAGWACLQYTINPEGRVEKVDVVATDYPEYGAWAARSLGTEVYEPARKDGKPVAFRGMVAVANEGLGSDPLSEFPSPLR